MTTRRTARVVVVGGGMAGMLTAAAAARTADSVAVVDRDELPEGPAARRGVPQARHAHLLWSGGARAVEALLPGIERKWLAAGARRLGIPGDVVSYTAQGWLRRGPSPEYMMACSRDLLDWVVREQTLALGRVTLRQNTQVLALLGDATRVTGVRVRDTATGEEGELPADLVVDASGRGSRAPHWLAELGCSRPVPERVVDSGLAYASRVFRAPPQAADHSGGFPMVSVQSDPRRPVPGQGAVLLPIEGDRWLVTLSGTRGGEPSTDEGEFTAFARGLRHPVVADLIAGAEPLGPLHYTRGLANRRRYFERLRPWPRGFLVLGDAVASYNPVYGHGMAVAAQSAAALAEGLAKGLADGADSGPDTAALQRALARRTAAAWTTATSQDSLYPEVLGGGPGHLQRLTQGYLDRLIRTANDRPAAARALFGAFALSAPPTGLLAPAVLLATALGPKQAPPTEPPFTRRADGA